MVRPDLVRENLGIVLRQESQPLYTQVQDHVLVLVQHVLIPEPPELLNVSCDHYKNDNNDSDTSMNDQFVCMLKKACDAAYNKLMTNLGKTDRYKRDRGAQFLGNALSVAIGTATEPMIGGLSEDIKRIVREMDRRTVEDDKRNEVLAKVSLHVDNLLKFINQHVNEGNARFDIYGTVILEHINHTQEMFQNKSKIIIQEWEEQQELRKINYAIQNLLQYQQAVDMIGKEVDSLDQNFGTE